MIDLKIERLRLNIQNAAGHEHRIEPIALRALTLLANKLENTDRSLFPERQLQRIECGARLIWSSAA